LIDRSGELPSVGKWYFYTGCRLTEKEKGGFRVKVEGRGGKGGELRAGGAASEGKGNNRGGLVK